MYRDLKRRAAAYLRQERRDHTLQPTAVVHEAFLRIAGHDRIAWQNRAHFFGIASQMMRRILVDHARAHRAAKRPDQALRVECHDRVAATEPRDCELLALDFLREACGADATLCADVQSLLDAHERADDDARLASPFDALDRAAVGSLGQVLQPGDRLGPHEILLPLGFGGMGEVYKARDTRLNRIMSTLGICCSRATGRSWRSCSTPMSCGSSASRVSSPRV